MKHAVQVIGAALCAVLLLAGCSNFNITLPTVKGSGGSSQTSSAKKSTDTVSTAGKEKTSSSQAKASSAEEEGRGSGNEKTVSPVSTDSEAFNKKFSSNPIDTRYASELGTLMATRDIVQLASKFTDSWNGEIKHAMTELKAKAGSDATKWSKIQADQKKWEDGKDAAIEEIGKNAQAGGGSVAQVIISSKVMEYYRARAAQLYRILYDYEPNFGYAYSD